MMSSPREGGSPAPGEPLSPSAAPRLSAGYRLWVSVFVVAVIGLQWRSIIGSYEAWPFLSNAMFAWYLDRERTPLYELRLWVGPDEGALRPLMPFADLGVSEVGFARIMFARYYWSTDGWYPQGHHGPDSPADFERRIARLMTEIADTMARRKKPVGVVRLTFGSLGTLAAVQAQGGGLKARPDDRRVIATYDVAQKRFELASPR
jgi:hypothetical protein